MILERRNDDSNDQFPVGMRVLAVDDDHVCLRLLETLLRKCSYHVTTRDGAIDALKLLRENKDKFDLVISDVHMPDMDGFKLLEQVGLEMDLPVIMLSANGDTKLVLKGISHGACDYLLKPVRLEELKNIWQHVYRRKKNNKDQDNSENQEKSSGTGNSIQGERVSKRKKDQNENEDPSSQKKSRFIWTVELHRKFVAAVNHLGLKRAFPMKILELMNVEKLTRDNVASHLQKYKLYLERLSSMANQQANTVAALGGMDSAYLQMNAIDFHNLNGSAPYQNGALKSLPPAALGIHGLSPSGVAPLGHAQMNRNPANDSNKFQLPRGQSGNILQWMPTSIGLDQLHTLHKKNDATIPSSSTFLQGHSQEYQGQGEIGNQSSVLTVPFKSDSAFGLTDPNICNGIWPSGSSSNPIMQPFISSNNVHPTALDGASESLISSNISRFDTRYPTAVFGNNGTENMGYASQMLWGDHKLDIDHQPDLTNSLMNPLLVGDPTGVFFGENNEFGFMGHASFESSSAHHTAAGISGIYSRTNMGGFTVIGAGSLEDVVTSLIKREGSDLGSDTYPL